MLEREVTRSDVASPLIHSRENMCWSCRPGRWMEGGREGEGGGDGPVKTQAGVPFCWPHNCTTQGDKRWRVSRSTPPTHPPTHTQSSSATLSFQPPASFASTTEQPACLFSTRWRLTGTLCRLKQQQKERGATAVLLVAQKMSARTFLGKTHSSNTSNDATWQRNTQRGVGELWKWKSCWWKSGPRA